VDCRHEKYLGEADRVSDRNRERYARKRESALKAARAYYEKNRERILASQRLPSARAATNARVKERRARMPEFDKVRARQRRWTNLRWLWETKQAAGCEICGEHDPDVLVLHHLDPTEKDMEINLGRYTGGMSAVQAQTQEELAKCSILCANCHTKVHRLLFIAEHEADVAIAVEQYGKDPSKLKFWGATLPREEPSAELRAYMEKYYPSAISDEDHQ